MRYFKDDELECHCDRCKDKGTATKVSPILRKRLEQLRERWGDCINVTCAYRCPEHNQEVGGVANSPHVDGTAADIYPSGNHPLMTFYGFVLGSGLFDGVGIYATRGFVHVDVRAGGNEPDDYNWDGDHAGYYWHK